MKFNQELLKKLSYLSRLEFEEKEAKQLARELERIISYFDKLKTFPNKLAQREALSLDSLPLRKARSDKKTAEALLNNAPLRERRYIKIKSLFGEKR